MSTRSTRGAIGALMITLAAGGCAPEYGRISINARDGEAGSSASASGLRLHEGEAMLFEARVRAAAGSRPYEGLEVLELEAFDHGIAVVRPSILVDAWVVSGARVGSTALEVRVDGAVVDTIPIEVEGSP